MALDSQLVRSFGKWRAFFEWDVYFYQVEWPSLSWIRSAKLVNMGVALLNYSLYPERTLKYPRKVFAIVYAVTVAVVFGPYISQRGSSPCPPNLKAAT